MKRTKHIACIILLSFFLVLAAVGCVSSKSYRSAKAQMIYDELQIGRLTIVVDSLKSECVLKDAKLAEREKEMKELQGEVKKLRTEKSKLEVDNALLRDENKKK